ncbi:MAG: isochorismatase family protein [Thermodesulfobacteriota bacterium]
MTDDASLKITLQTGDALIIVDLQNDFLPGGSLAVPRGEQVIGPLNKVIFLFTEKKLPIFATRDWHPAGHVSFMAQGGPWPQHCVQETKGAFFASDLKIPCQARIVSKGTNQGQDNYSGFEGTDLDSQLCNLQVGRLFVGGLAQDVCVKSTVLDACRLGYKVFVLQDGTRPVNLKPDDGEKAFNQMEEAGARIINTGQLYGKIEE